MSHPCKCVTAKLTLSLGERLEWQLQLKGKVPVPGKGKNVTLSARTSGDVPRPWTSLGRPRTTPDVPARPVLGDGIIRGNPTEWGLMSYGDLWRSPEGPLLGHVMP